MTAVAATESRGEAARRCVNLSDMRIAVLNDIHGNLPALDAVLDQLSDEAIDLIVVGGDILPDPMPHLVLRRLLAAGIPVEFIYGNGEVAGLEHFAGKVPTLVPESYRPIIRWNAEQLESAERQMVADWPFTRRLQVPPLGD